MAYDSNDTSIMCPELPDIVCIVARGGSKSGNRHTDRQTHRPSTITLTALGLIMVHGVAKSLDMNHYMYIVIDINYSPIVTVVYIIV